MIEKIIISCNKCLQKLRVPNNIRSIIVKCPKCGFQWITSTDKICTHNKETTSNKNQKSYYNKIYEKIHPERIFLPYEVVDLEQGSKLWIEWRYKGIGASDAPAIMGENPWKSRKKLLKEKIDKIESVKNFAMSYGTSLEPAARKSYVLHKNMKVFPLCLQSKNKSWLRASVDGLSMDGKVVVEIKCGKKVYEYASSNNKVPKYYIGQLQHILAVTGLSSIDFWCYLPHVKPILIEIERDNYYISRMLEEEHKFWEELLLNCGY